MAQYVGGYEQALELDASEALRWKAELLEEAEIEAWQRQVDRYYSSLGLYSNVAKLPDMPEPPKWLQKRQSSKNTSGARSFKDFFVQAP